MEQQSNKNTDDVTANRQIKDGVFRLLFDNPENAAELYYALTGIECSPDEIQIITITTIVSGNLKNDLAFVVRDKALIIGEHMASSCVNMPLRFLMYTGQLYEKWIKINGEEKFLYSGGLYKIPTPAFVVFYNGNAASPEKEIFRLSSAFVDAADKDLGFLELEVPVYNINKGMNEELFKKSGKLKQYAEFTAKLKEFIMVCEDYSQAVRQTVNHCITNGILADFFKEQGGKIVSILATEYDFEADKRVCIEERLEGVAINLLKLGMSVDVVIKATGLSETIVKQLNNEFIL